MSDDFDCDGIEVPRDDGHSTDPYGLDTTTFFEPVLLNDDGIHLLKTANGETVQINSSEEVDIDTFIALQSLNISRNEDKTVNSEFDDNEVEIPRGYGVELSTANNGADEEVYLTCTDEDPKNVPGGKKLEDFLRNIKRDPEWARSISYVKLNASISKSLQMEFVTHAYLHVNSRPKQMIVLTKTMDTTDLLECIKKAFQSREIPLERSFFRLYCRNSAPTLKSLIRTILAASSSSRGFKVEYSDVLGELCHKDMKIRMKTSDIKTFCKLEDIGRSLGIRFLTTFKCWSTKNTHCLMEIRYYDELKANGSHVTYLHLDHEAFNCRPLVFSEAVTEIPFEVDNDNMTPVHQMYPPVYDLNELIKRLHAQESQ